MAKREKDEHSPLMKQYLEFKARVGDAVLFFRVGDFYEIFFEDAARASRHLDITLTARGSANGAPIPMAGVPWHALDLHLGRLLRQGVSAAVVDQVGDPATSKGPVDRELRRILSPGTLLDEALLNPKADAPLAAAIIKEDRAALFWVSLSSGQAHHCEMPASALADELARIAPAELLAPEGLDLRVGSLKAQPTPAWRFDAAKGATLVLEHFGAASLESFGLAPGSLALSAACAAMSHAQTAMGGRRPNIAALSAWNRSGFLIIDESTRLALEIHQNSARERRGPGSLIDTLDRASTAMGSRALERWLGAPLADAGALRARQGAAQALEALGPELVERIQGLLKGLPDLERAAARGASRASRPRDFSNIRACLRGSPGVCSLLGPARKASPLIESLCARMIAPKELLDWLESAVAELPPVHARDPGFTRDKHSAELDELRLLATDIDSALKAFEAKEREATGIPTLRIDYNKAHGFCIELSKAQSAKAPERYERRATLKNAERYITPELMEFERKALSAESRLLALEKALFEKAQIRLESDAQKLLVIAEALSELDALLCFAALAHIPGHCWPEVIEGAGMHIEGGRHAVSEMLMEHFQPNDCHLDPGGALLITGPNMGGKSTFMRQNALICLLAQTGAPVPAKSARLPLLERIFARVGASDDIANGRSTFMVEMSEMARILRHANERSLCIVDEVGRGTSTYDGLAIAWASLAHIAQVNKSLCLFSTHYFELTEMAKELPCASQAHMGATREGNELLLTHELMEGPTDKSYGVDVARMAGLPALAIEWAKAAQLHWQQRDSALTGVAPQASLATAMSSAQAERESQALQALLATPVDELSPRQAHELLRALQAQLGAPE